MKTLWPSALLMSLVSSTLLLGTPSAQAQDTGAYQVFVSNEKAGTVTIFSGTDFKVLATLP